MLRHSERSKNCPAYLYIEPIEHIESYNELSIEAWLEFGKVMGIAVEWIYKHYSPKKLYTVSISEAVKHLHFHLVPRYQDDILGIEYLSTALSAKLPEIDVPLPFKI
ncbi:MAG: HIT family hydrolase [Leptospiraceae bacterium]|nr:HIT family hydrolase [Leptospiraceae bacterium]MCP5499989.1 HIT family hydrolase [Leptospiraceae bacterium]